MRRGDFACQSWEAKWMKSRKAARGACDASCVAVRSRSYSRGISGGDGIEESGSRPASTNGPGFVTFTVVGVSRALTARRFSSLYYGVTNDPFFFSFPSPHSRHTRAPRKFTLRIENVSLGIKIKSRCLSWSIIFCVVFFIDFVIFFLSICTYNFRISSTEGSFMNFSNDF